MTKTKNKSETSPPQNINATVSGAIFPKPININSETADLLNALKSKKFEKAFFSHLNAKQIVKRFLGNYNYWLILIFTIAGSLFFLGANASLSFFIIMPICIVGLGFGTWMLSNIFNKSFDKNNSENEIKSFYEKSDEIRQKYDPLVIKRAIQCLKYDVDGEYENIRALNIFTPFSVLFLASMWNEADLKNSMALPVAMLSFVIAIYAFGCTRDLLLEKHKISILERAERLSEELVSGSTQQK